MASRALRLFRSYSSASSSSPTTQVAAEARRKWGLGGVPSPRSILNDDTVPVDLSEDDDIVNGARPNTPPLHLRRPPSDSTPAEWRAHRQTIKATFPEGWQPPRKISREAMDGLRELHKIDPERFSTPVLAERFRISPEAVRRILKSKWEPSQERKVQWATKQQRARAEKLERKKQVLLKEKQEAEEIWLGKEFSGGLSLRG